MTVHTCSTGEFSRKACHYLRLADQGDVVRVVDTRSGKARRITAETDTSDLDAARMRKWSLRGLRPGAPGHVGAAS